MSNPEKTDFDAARGIDMPAWPDNPSWLTPFRRFSLATVRHECTCYLRGDTPRVCSHVAAQKTKKGEPLFTDKAAIIRAAELLGCQVVDRNTYNWYQRHVGDYPVPPGMKASELGKNALFVIQIAEPKRSELAKKFGAAPYDVGVIADPNNPGCFTLIYDFWNSGYGVDEVLGAPVRNGKYEIQLLCPLFKQTYDMVCEQLGAQEAGDGLEVLSMAQARAKYPHAFADIPAQADDDKTWVSFASTDNRIKVE